ncbi:MAG TPA: hypothetical protein VJT75_14645 [Thermoleophilaceae bacterium]|nr:hypothetical protein [Thermoleophilaceae bacterium]
MRTLADALDEAGTRDDTQAAMAATEAMLSAGRLDPALGAQAIAPRFFGKRDTTPERVEAVFAAALRGAQLAPDLPPIIAIDEIDSFASVASVTREQVAKLTYPLKVAEDDIKAAINKILAEPFVTAHSPAELSDIFTSATELGGKRVLGGFLLKGPGLGRNVMRVADLGTNGNQIIKLTRSEAELLIVQFVGQIDEDVHSHLRQAVVHERTAGKRAVGSIWDGVDTARVLAAHGWLDTTTGVYSGPRTKA